MSEISYAVYDEYGLHWKYVELDQPLSEILDLSEEGEENE